MGPQGNLRPLPPRPQGAPHLPGQIDAGLPAEPEGVQIFPPGLGFESLGYLGGSDVAGMSDHFHGCQVPVGLHVVNPMSSKEVLSLLTVERGLFGNQTFLHRCCQEKSLHGGARFEGVRNAPIPPPTGTVSMEAVGIEAGRARHGEDFPGPGIQDNGRSRGSPRIPDTLAKGPFGSELYPQIQGENDFTAAAAARSFRNLSPQQSATGIPLKHETGLGPPYVLVVMQLQALQSLRINAYEADHICGEFPVRVITFALSLHPDPTEAQCLDGSRPAQRQLAGQPDEGDGLLQLGLQGAGVHFQMGSQQARGP